MTTSDIINAASVISSIASLILAIIAIWLSFVFYRMGTQASESTNKASAEVHESVGKLEQLFNRMYSDTFTMMKDTVANMQKHMWPEKMSDVTATEEATQAKTEQRIAELKEQMSAELAAYLAKQKNPGGGAETIQNLQKDLMPMLDRAITESNKVTVETREEIIREAIMTVLVDLAQNHMYTVAADEMVGRIDKKYALSFGDTLITMKNLREEGLVQWEGPDYVLSSTHVNINPDIVKHAPEVKAKA